MASRFWRPSWIFASVQNCSNFCVWHSTDLDSAGQNHIETIKKLYICKKTWFNGFWHDFARTIYSGKWSTIVSIFNECTLGGRGGFKGCCMVFLMSFMMHCNVEKGSRNQHFQSTLLVGREGSRKKVLCVRS